MRPGSLIDLHCHILPGLDDGARDLDDSLAMARQAQADGIGVVCATPHIRPDHDVRIDELAGRVAELNEAIAREGIAVRVVAGGEVAEPVAAELTDAELGAVSLDGAGRWVLLEPAPGPLSDGLARAVENLRRRGCRAVIAHPERHLAEDLSQRLSALVTRGALVQATAALLAEGDAVEGMQALAGRGLVHVLGSDAHSSRAGRPVALDAGLAGLAGVDRVATHLDWIARTAPRGILAGEQLHPPFGPAG